ncbi:MAG: DUF3108 domain-containing protein [Proteobacteria bacterium]|nr:DUF3108 domain-containing protein [Pseudomonadota bacterium]
MLNKILFKPLLFLVQLLLLFISLNNSHASSLTACYDVKVFFFKVGESCITYSLINKNLLRINSHMKTVNIGSLAKRIYDYGSSEANLDHFSPQKFVFHQEEGTFKRYQEYIFKEDKIYVTERKFKKLSSEIEKEENKIYKHSGEFDPYIAALFLFKNFKNIQSGIIPIFYDDRFYRIPWQVLEKITIKTSNGEAKCQKVIIKPQIKGKGLLQPKGEWFLYIDEDTLIPLKMEIGFIIGSVKVELVNIEGDKKLLTNLKY